MSNTFDKLSVLDSFIEEVNSYLPEIETNFERLAQSPGDMEALDETYRRTHTIGGSASMMDFPGLAHVAHGMEDILGDVLDGVTVVDQPTLTLLRRSLGRLHRLVNGIRDNSVNEDTVIAEDDADYTQYRMLVESASLPAAKQAATSGHSGPLAKPDFPGYQSPSASVQEAYSYQQSQLEPTQEQYYYQSPAQEQPQYQSPAQEQPQQQSYYSQEPELPQQQYQQPEPQPALPSFDEMLAAFRTPVVAEGEDLAWPEDPVAPEHFDTQAPYQPPTDYFAASALDMLVATTRNDAASYPSSPGLPSSPEQYAQLPQSPQPVNNVASHPGLTPATPSSPDIFKAPTPAPERPEVQSPASGQLPITHISAQFSALSPQEAEPFAAVPLNARPSSELPGMPRRASGQLLSLHSEMLGEAESLEHQALALQETLSQIRQAVGIIETQRTEFRTFLDGSKDALDRMEEWAGQAMGLNLRNSPEQVRRYLPLSVMWVANSKLKKILELLARIAGGIEVTDEQVRTTVQQLQGSIEALNHLPSEPASASSGQAGWTPWEAQLARDAEGLRESVTFERRGDPTSLRAELEEKLREELRQEYESRPLTLAARMELEQQIRTEVRQEFEQKRLLQEEFIGSEGQESYDEMESRLRNEIEIQVRREFLSQITVPGDATTSLNSSSGRGMASANDLQEMMVPRIPVTPPPLVAPQAPAMPTSPSTASAASDFGEEAAEIFRLEAEEHLQTISMQTAILERVPHDREVLQSIRRATHTLKGAAGMMGFRMIADLCHVSEDLLESIMDGSISITSPVLSIILDTAETLDRLINNREDRGKLEAAVQTMRLRYAELLGEQRMSPLPTEEEIDNDLDGQENSALVGTMAQADGEPVIEQGVRSELSVRVRLQKLDELVNLFGELLVNRSVLEERIQRLVRLVSDVGVSSERLRDVGQKLESRFEAVMLPSGRTVQVMPGTAHSSGGLPPLLPAPTNGRSEPAHLAEFDELELDRYTEFHQLARGLTEGISDMTTLSSEMEAVIRECESVFARENRLSATFQDRLMKARLVPLSSMIPRLYRTARSVALKQHKEINFVTEGEETEVDRTVYEEIAGPLLHLLRNAVNHGLETPDVRTRHRKPAAGLVKFSAAYEGNQVIITVRDDGMGIDPELVRQAAVSRGLIRPDQPLGPNEVIDLIFRPGFSTASVLSEESGRGVGLDVVRDSISRLRATLEVDSTPGQGTAFTMKFPTSLAIQGVMMVRLGDQQFAIPTALVESIGRLDTFKHTTYGGRPAVLVQNELYPLNQLSLFLKLPTGLVDDRAPLLLVNTGRHRVALVVDEIRGRMDVVMKNLGPHLRHVHGIAGGTVLGNGRVTLILELNELLSTQLRSLGNIAGTVRESVLVPPTQTMAPTMRPVNEPGSMGATVTSGARTTIPSASTPAPERGKHVLVVDDSPSVRRVVGNMLKQHGWEVQMARDGVEALESITSQAPAAVLLDIEMPRMDGYELMATVRAQEQYRTLPLVVLTSRAAAKHQQRAMQLGASAYIVKPYQDEELITTLNTLVYGAGV